MCVSGHHQALVQPWHAWLVVSYPLGMWVAAAFREDESCVYPALDSKEAAAVAPPTTTPAHQHQHHQPQKKGDVHRRGSVDTKRGGGGSSGGGGGGGGSAGVGAGGLAGSLWLHSSGFRVDTAAMLMRHTLSEAFYLTMVRYVSLSFPLSPATTRSVQTALWAELFDLHESRGRAIEVFLFTGCQTMYAQHIV
jgi:hypothetical protein